ncbi:sulfotransferase [Nonomuraea phyllanthi]|uniref:sulfotransferase n=1 Tax=Nonomuraea phyllanthi TaxID=2219224 RepID=UPI001D14F389|nr:sulfotransferase [Nonomuraea phyllanthi]
MTDRATTTRVIFLGGLGRSGTTLLERLLGELPGVVALGEVVHLWERGVLAEELCGCGTPFPACPFWRQVGERAFGGWTQALVGRVLTLRRRVDRTRRITRIAHPDLAEYVQAYRLLYEATGAPVVIDSSKHASLACCLVAGGVDVRVVHVVRDPRAVAHSWARTVRRPEDGRPMTRWGPARTALHWTAQNTALELLRGRGARVTRIRYEDLLADPGRTLRALALDLNLVPGPGSDLSSDVGRSDLGLVPGPGSDLSSDLDPDLGLSRDLGLGSGSGSGPGREVGPDLSARLGRDLGLGTGFGPDLSPRPGPDLSPDFGLGLGSGESDLPFLDGHTAWLGTSHTASGNPMRFHVGRIELRRDDVWTTQLRAGDRRLVDALTWPLRVRYGYREAS